MNKIKVLMIPSYDAVGEPSGISRVIENYLKYGETVGIEFVDKAPYDLVIAHAGMIGQECDVSILHGLYFTGDYKAPAYEYEVNKMIADSVRGAYAVTVPSSWVSEIFLRDMHIRPFVVPHGIDADDWKHSFDNEGYFLYNKNRDGVDVCDSVGVDRLAGMARDQLFISTFSKASLPNMKVIGVQNFEMMKPIIQKAAGYLSLTKETFGIGVLEAMSSGVPVLGWRFGGNLDLVQHGINGYLAEPGNYDDLNAGMRYILNNRKVLSHNARYSVSQWTWENAVKKLREVLDYAIEKKNETVSVSVVVPAYNYGNKIGKCLYSLSEQTLKPSEIIVVDDGSEKEQADLTKLEADKYGATYIKKENGGVATARNLGAKHSRSKYLCFIDADDALDPDYLEVCVRELEKDRSLYIAYTGLLTVHPDGRSNKSQWPGQWDFDAQLMRRNQVPTCCVMRREVIERTGGYRQRFAPRGAGTEDADLWTRAGSLGMKAKQVTDAPLFLYSAGTGNTSKSGYTEVDWLGWKGYIKTGKHPFASYAKPKKMSHEVYQYDQPMISVIIPVGPGHENNITEALDSIEGQTYKNWEAIVVSDTDKDIDLSAWPFVKFFSTNKPGSGPGTARNIGAENARGRFVVFLDADDWLDINALDMMLTHFVINKGIVYTDYMGIAYINPDDVAKFGKRVESYDAKTHRAVMRHRSDLYSCERAQQQPSDPLYHWCIVTCLIPKVWHDEIGGFDEKMPSWEDVDYHWRMAQHGKCYSKLEEPLVYYNFSTGHRRAKADPENNIEVAKSLLEYMARKYEGIKPMGCKSCGGSGGVANFQVRDDQSVRAQSVMGNIDNEFSLCLYNHPNRGTHRVIGPASGRDYGYRSGGDSFLVHYSDSAMMPGLFIKEFSNVNGDGTVQAELNEIIDNKPKEIAPPVMLGASSEKPFDINTIPGITPGIGAKLTEVGIDSYEKLFALSEVYLLTIDGISTHRAKVIMSAIEKVKEKQLGEPA